MSAYRMAKDVVTATVQEVLPRFGLAYLLDDGERCWAVTRSMQGSGLDDLEPGQRVHLTIDHHDGFSVVSAYDRMM